MKKLPPSCHSAIRWCLKVRCLTVYSKALSLAADISSAQQETSCSVSQMFVHNSFQKKVREAILCNLCPCHAATIVTHRYWHYVNCTVQFNFVIYIIMVLFLHCQACVLTSPHTDHKASFYQESNIFPIGTQCTCAMFVIRLHELSQHSRIPRIFQPKSVTTTQKIFQQSDQLLSL